MIAIESATLVNLMFSSPFERPIPTPGSGEVLIEVAPAGVNRPELRQHETTEQKLATKARRPERRASLIVWWSSTRRTRVRDERFSRFRGFAVSCAARDAA